jgi:hypothetical protein
MQKHAASFDFILDAVSADHDPWHPLDEMADAEEKCRSENLE